MDITEFPGDLRNSTGQYQSSDLVPGRHANLTTETAGKATDEVSLQNRMRPVAALFSAIPKPRRPLKTSTRRFSCAESTALQMAGRSTGVIPFRRSASISETDELIAEVVYRLWLSTPFRCGPAEDVFFTALQMVKENSSAGPFLVPRRKQNIPSIVAIKRHPSG
jgi:hypothetical protein